MDTLTPEQRYKAMSRNGGRTGPERALASELWRRGLRYLTYEGYKSISGKRLVGKPDLVFSRERIVVFVDGCFWHGCLTCGKSVEQSGKFWVNKIAGNRKRDRQVTTALESDGWTVLRIPEHDVRKKALLKRTVDRLASQLLAVKKTMKKRMAKLTAVDLFAGGGGLTEGLKRAGFHIVAAVESDDHAAATYKVNHPEVCLLRRDAVEVSGSDLGWKIDLLAGCPPCQGFTRLNRRLGDDPRNKLIFQMFRIAREMRPKAIMMENVPGLTTKGKDDYEQLKRKLESLGYKLKEGLLDAADYGVPQRRLRLILLGGLGFEIQMPQATHGGDGLPWRTVRHAIGSMESPLTFSEARKEGKVLPSDWHLVRTLSEKTLSRLMAAKPGKSWTHIPEELRPECHRNGFRGFSNVYGRMEWDKPSPTITGGCTTFSKGRFGHPEANRTISVREAALLQTFPKKYKFDTPYIDRVCNIVGNALPCKFAEILSKQCHDAILAQSV